MTLPVADLDASRRFYSAALGALGWEELEVDGRPTWGPPGGEDFSIERYHPGYYGAYVLDRAPPAQPVVDNNVEAVFHDR
jgi:catechol 2,3-dioxygenase-like lactoylglutathione lyase family enzyme